MEMSGKQSNLSNSRQDENVISALSQAAVDTIRAEMTVRFDVFRRIALEFHGS